MVYAFAKYAWAWLSGGSVAAALAPYVLLSVGLFSAGWAYGAARADRSAEIATLRSEIAAHEVANGLREISERLEGQAAASAADADRHNEAIIQAEPTHEKDNGVFSRDYLGRLRKLR